MKRKRRTFTPEIKSKIALEAIKGDKGRKDDQLDRSVLRSSPQLGERVERAR